MSVQCREVVYSGQQTVVYFGSTFGTKDSTRIHQLPFISWIKRASYDAKLVPLELLDGGDPITGRLVGQPVIVELPHLEAKHQFPPNISNVNNFLVNSVLRKQKALKLQKGCCGQFRRYWQFKTEIKSKYVPPLKYDHHQPNSKKQILFVTNCHKQVITRDCDLDSPRPRSSPPPWWRSGWWSSCSPPRSRLSCSDAHPWCLPQTLPRVWKVRCLILVKLSLVIPTWISARCSWRWSWWPWSSCRPPRWWSSPGWRQEPPSSGWNPRQGPSGNPRTSLRRPGCIVLWSGPWWWCCLDGVWMCSEVLWLLEARRLTWSLHLAEISRDRVLALFARCINNRHPSLESSHLKNFTNLNTHTFRPNAKHGHH